MKPAKNLFMLLLVLTGFEVIDPQRGFAKPADTEIKAIDRAPDKLIVTDRQTVVIDLTEKIADKAVLRKAGAIIAECLSQKLRWSY